MKTIFTFFIAFLLLVSTAWGCPVCTKQQPKILQGITHGAGPEDNWDYLIVSVSVAVVIGTLLCSIHYIIKPGEANSDHIKYSILKRKYNND